MEKKRITAEALQVRSAGPESGKSGGSSQASWSAFFGEVTLLTGCSRQFLRAVLRTLAGLEKPVSGKIMLEQGDTSVDISRGDIRTAWLPPPGEEVFVGATVEEELAFSRGAAESETALGEGPGSFAPDRFLAMPDRSVWELSSSERRLLLLSAQAGLSPSLWCCFEPLSYLDGAMSRLVLEGLEYRAEKGAAVIVAAEDPATLLGSADTMVVFDSEGRLKAVFKPSESSAVGMEDFSLQIAASRARKGKAADPFSKT